MEYTDEAMEVLKFILKRLKKKKPFSNLAHFGYHHLVDDNQIVHQHKNKDNQYHFYC